MPLAKELFVDTSVLVRAAALKLSYCDAVSFVIVRQRLGDMACLAFDRDFRALGLTVLA